MLQNIFNCACNANQEGKTFIDVNKCQSLLSCKNVKLWLTKHSIVLIVLLLFETLPRKEIFLLYYKYTDNTDKLFSASLRSNNVPYLLTYRVYWQSARTK